MGMKDVFLSLWTIDGNEVRLRTGYHLSEGASTDIGPGVFDAGTLTIASGAITLPAIPAGTAIVRVVVDTEDAAATDDLDTVNITGTVATGTLMILASAASARDVNVTTGGTGINLQGATAGVLSSSVFRMVFVRAATNWVEMVRSASTSGILWSPNADATALVYNENGSGVADLRVEGDTATNAIFVDASADAVGFAQGTPTAHVHIGAGTATAGTAPLKLTSGINLSTPEAGVFGEYDGAGFYSTIGTVAGRGLTPSVQRWGLAANGSAIGATIADFFGATSSLSLAASAVYELEAELYFLKSTAGTVIYTLTTSAADYTNIAATYVQSPAAGYGTNAATTQGGIDTTTTAAAALPVTASLSDTAKHHATIRATIETNAAGNFRIRVTESAGTVTPLRGSFYKLTRIPAASIGTYVA